MEIDEAVTPSPGFKQAYENISKVFHMRTEAGRRIFLDLFLSNIVLLPVFNNSLRIFPQIEMCVGRKGRKLKGKTDYVVGFGKDIDIFDNTPPRDLGLAAVLARNNSFDNGDLWQCVAETAALYKSRKDAEVSFAWFQTCPASGVQTCISGQLPYNINATTSVSNCVFIGCPQVRVTSGVLTVNNVTFLNNNNAMNGIVGGGAISVVGNVATTGLVVNNCVFTNLTAVNGGAIYVYGPFNNQIQISNSVFTSNTATAGNGGAVAIYSSVVATVSNCQFTTNYAVNGGGAFYAESSSTITFNNNACRLNIALVRGGCICVLQSTTITGQWITGDSDYSPAGPAFFHADTGNVASFTNVFLNNATGLYGTAFYSFGPGTVRLRNVYVQAAVINGGVINNVIGVIVMQANTMAYFDNVTIINCVGGYAMMTYGSNLVWNNGLIKNHVGLNVLVNIYGAATSVYNFLTIQDSVGLSGTGSVLNAVTGSVQFSDCQIINSVTVSSGLFFSQIGDISFTRTTVTGSRGTAGNGGIICTSSTGRIFINGGVVFSNFSTVGSGAFLYNRGSGNITISPDVVIRNYSAGNPLATFAHFAGNPNGLFTGPSLQAASIDTGTIFVQYPSSASLVINSVLFKNYFPTGMKWVSNIPSNLRIVNANDLTGLSLIRSAQLPNIQVIPTDFFGNVLRFNPTLVYVVVQMVEIAQKATVTGETIKVVLDPVSNIAEFKRNDIRNKQPGVYTLQFQGIFNSLSPLATSPWPTLNVTITDCDPNTQRLVPSLNRCLAAIPINSALRSVASAVSIVGILALVAVTLSLYKFREHKVIKANSYRFITLAVFGSIIALISIPIQASQIANACMLSFWFENVGFTFTITSLIVKMNRLQKIFQKSFQSKIRTDLTDSILIRYLIIAVVLMVMYLGVWTGMQPSTLVDQILLSQNSVAINRCSSSTYNLIIITAKFLATLLAAQIAYSIRNIPSNFNETQVVGIACYNWVVFGTVINLINQDGLLCPQCPGYFISSSLFGLLARH